MKYTVLRILLAALVSIGLAKTESTDLYGVEVELPQGIVRSEKWVSRGGREFSAFLSIPYAEAGRFEHPREPSNWTGVWKHSGDVKCAQSFWISNAQIGKEDCLEISVYTPNVKAKNLPVLAYFHGGGFTMGSARNVKGGYLVDEDVVLVSANYRVGPLGFLSTGDEVLPGNLGLKDQSMALRWVQKNIAKFGGDPNKVVIGGGSAGAASINYHLISPMSAGLFHGAISFSGTVVCPWTWSHNPKEVAKRYAGLVGCPTESSQVIVDCLKKKSLKELMDGVAAMVEWGYDPFTPFAPTTEVEIPGQNFLTETPEYAMSKGHLNKVPWINGVVESEGLMMHAGYVITEKKLMDDLNHDYRRVFPITLQYNWLYDNFTSAEQDHISEKVHQYYFGDAEINEKNFRALEDEREGFSSLQLIGLPPRKGVGHADEYTFVFQGYHNAPEHAVGSDAEKVSKNLVKMIASFIRDGKPSALWGQQREWNPVSAEEAEGKKPILFYRIAAETALSTALFAKRYYFWEDLLAKVKNARVSKDEL